MYQMNQKSDQGSWLLFSFLIMQSNFDNVQTTLIFYPKMNLSDIVYKGLTGTDIHCLQMGKYVLITVSIVWSQ